MQRTFLHSKIHRAVVTDAQLNYEGSLTVDSNLLAAANMSELELVSIVNINNGERFETYLIPGESGSGVICLNGAAARKAQIGDKLIVMTYCSLDAEELLEHKPTIVIVDDQNKIKSITDKVIAGKVF
ncbi:MAG: aspartate 1-decarboxylase [Ignavibacteria bacterium]|jgi:aspartate 1-decarboxylase|nr:aspartate 1-decarboxylase [Ignavibacteria bacterium]